MPLASYCIIRLMYQLSYSLFAFVFLEGCFFFFFVYAHKLSSQGAENVIFNEFLRGSIGQGTHAFNAVAVANNNNNSIFLSTYQGTQGHR